MIIETNESKLEPRFLKRSELEFGVIYRYHDKGSSIDQSLCCLVNEDLNGMLAKKLLIFHEDFGNQYCIQVFNYSGRNEDVQFEVMLDGFQLNLVQKLS